MISCSFPIIKCDFNCGNKPYAINADMVIMDLSRSYSLFSLLQTPPNKTSSLGSANFGANFPKLSLPAVCFFIIITITFQAANILLKIINASLQPDNKNLSKSSITAYASAYSKFSLIHSKEFIKIKISDLQRCIDDNTSGYVSNLKMKNLASKLYQLSSP